MVAIASAAPIANTSQIPIETMRAIAILLLVSYHVIGPDQGAGLAVGYPDLLRLFADFFIDLRMPFFAFIAGYLYARRPPIFGYFAHFVQGKARRLYLPCAIASLLFVSIAGLAGNRFALPLEDTWRILVTSYAHFWFLQSILVIFICFGFVDSLTQHRATWVFLAASVALYLSPVVLNTSAMSVNGGFYLLPYFLLGVLMNRYGSQLRIDAEKLSMVVLCVAVTCALWNIKTLYETGSFSLVRRDLQSLGFGLSICTLVYLYAPRVPMLEKLSPYGFTIYLYHIFGTVAARETCDVLQLSAMELRFGLGLIGGLALPILLHESISRVPRLSQLMLGRTARPKSRNIRISRQMRHS